MRYLLRVDSQLDTVRGMSTAWDRTYVRFFDHDAHDGRGALVITQDPEKALAFSNLDDAKTFWARKNRFGKHPMMRVSVELTSLEVARIIHNHGHKVLKKS
jgi:hypothetical protein